MKFDYRFRDPALVELALTHRSIGRPNNERLEFLGDALINMMVGEMLYEVRVLASEGELSRLRSQLVNGQTLAEIARELELGDDLRLGPGELKSGGFRRDSILADAFEALIAAVYLDSDFATCREVVRSLFQSRVTDMPRSRKDAKTRLQEWLQARGLPLPQYELESSYGEDHAKTFDVICRLGAPLELNTEGRGGSRRAAEQAAAEAAYQHLTEQESA